MDAELSLQHLKEGNVRARSEGHLPDSRLDLAHVKSLAEGQRPFAIILGCSDSRVPTEIIFDQPPGALFVIRVAGNIAGPTQLGSMEFAVENFDTPLIVVLGHSDCGAVKGALAETDSEASGTSPNLRAVLDQVRPAVEKYRGAKDAAAVNDAVRANVRAVADGLVANSDVLKVRIDSGVLRIVGAEYVLKTGEVVFLDEAP